MRELSHLEVQLVSAGTQEGANRALRTCEGFPDSAVVTIGANVSSNVTGDAKIVSGTNSAGSTMSLTVTCGDLREGGSRDRSGGGRAAGSTNTGVGSSGGSARNPTVTVGSVTRVN